MKLAGLVRGAMLLAALLACPCFGQLPGDWNGDGQVDSGDLPGLAQCLAGPGSTPGAGCSVFDFSGLGTIGALEAMAMAAMPRAAPVCEIWRNDCGETRGYVGINVLDNSISASRADMRRAGFGALCGEPGGATDEAFSAAWTGITQVDLTRPRCQHRVQRWAQLGLIRSRNHVVGRPATQIAFEYYFEYEGDIEYDLTFPPVPAYQVQYRALTPGVTATYTVTLVDRWTGTVQFCIDDDQGSGWCWAFASPRWNSQYCNRADFTTETLNIGDRTPGVLNSRFELWSCRYTVGDANEVTPDFFAWCDDSLSSCPGYFRGHITAVDSLEAWDLRVP